MRLKWLHKDKLCYMHKPGPMGDKGFVCVCECVSVCVFVRMKEVEVEGLGCALHLLIQCALSLMCELGCVEV